ncbi:MAG: RNA polymerase sigma factor [Verrucomicrobiales bacterium]
MPEPRRSDFSATRWTLVLEAGGETPQAKAALRELCDIYYAPVVAFIRRWRQDGDEDLSRDQAHAFFESVLANEQIGAPDPQRGRFRNYLLGAVKHFLLEQRRLAATQKRGGGVPHEPLDEGNHAGAEPGAADFDCAWALALIGRALGELESEMGAAGKSEQFTVLRPWLDGNAETPQAEAAEVLGLSGTAIKVAIHRLRERFRTKVRAEVEATLQDPGELDEELRHLVVALGAGEQG